jgi:hypothetical protein
VLPVGLSGAAGAACVACCVIPLLLAVGVLGGAGWVVAGRVMPGVALGLVAAAGLAWWWRSRRRLHREGCSGAGCSCHTPADHPEVPGEGEVAGMARGSSQTSATRPSSSTSDW